MCNRRKTLRLFARTTKTLLYSKFRAKITVMLRIKKISKSLFSFHILEILIKNYQNKNSNVHVTAKIYLYHSSKSTSSVPPYGLSSEYNFV